MEDSQENSFFSELINKSYIYIDYKENLSQNPNFTFSQYDENKSEKLYDDYTEQIGQTKTEKEINSSEEENSESSILQGEIDSENDTEPIKKYSNVHYFCKNCRQIPMIKFIDDLNISYTCECYKNCQRNITKFLDDTLLSVNKEEENNILIDVFSCKKHKGKKFLYYCEICNISLCSDCLEKEEKHLDHSPKIFDLLMNETDEKIEYIKDKFNLNSYSFDNNSSNFLSENLDKLIKYSNFIKFINALINDYNNYTCYSHFLIINNLYQFLENLNNIQALELKNDINIKNINNLKKNINDSPKLITNIILINCNIYDITLFCKADLDNLITLNLKNNNIFNIEYLPSAKFKQIKTLDFSFNRIGDDNIKYFSQLKFKKLNSLNLYGNNFSDFKLFELCNNKYLKNLKKIYVGSNQFKNSEINITFDTFKLKEIALINGILNNESINFIHNFKFNNLKRIFLNNNNLSSLSFIDKLELPNIKEIWLNDNLIDEYYPLCKYKTLKVIKIKKNKITNINNLISFIDKFTKLSEIDISDNNIDLNDIKNKQIISDAQKKLDIINYF